MKSLILLFVSWLSLSVFGGEIIKNGNFEKGFADWSIWHKDMKDKYVSVEDGALVFTGDPAYKNNNLLNCNQPGLKLEPGKSYFLTGRIKAVNASKNPKKRIQAAIYERGERGKVVKAHVLHLPSDLSQGKWLEFKRSFTTSGNQVNYYQLILFARFPGKDEKIYIDDLSIQPDDPGILKQASGDYIQKMTKQGAKRRRVAERTYVFVRSQLKYNLGRNYLHWWIDRPLFSDRSLRGSHGQVYQVKPKSFLKDIEIVKLYGMDGLGALTCNSGQMINFQLACDVADKSKVKNFLLMPEFYGADLEKYYEGALKRALESDHAFKVKGKVVVGSYVATAWPPAKWTAFISKMKQKYGDKFIFIADIRAGMPVGKVQDGSITLDEIKADQQRIRDYLDVSDGVMFAGANHVRLYGSDNSYGDPVNVAYLRDYLVPLFKSVLAEDKYKDKLLGLSAAVAYINHFGGACKRQSGTKTLRETFATAMNAEPDFIESPEWNEFNENTCFQPTLTRSLSSQRIIRYYCRKMRKLVPDSNPGDNTAIPNLIYSCRRTAILGEKVNIELLNVPDSDLAEKYTVELALKDGSGKIVKKFPPVAFAIRDMKDHTFAIDTAEFAAAQVLVPEIKVTDYKKHNMTFADGLPFLRLSPSWNIDYLEVNQPLRDLAQLKCGFSGKVTGNLIKFTGNVDAKDKIMSVEIVKDGSEVWADDPLREFKNGEYAVFQMTVSNPAPSRLRGKLLFHGVSDFYCRSAGNDNMGQSSAEPDDPNLIPGKNDVTMNIYTCPAPRFLFICVPIRELDRAELEMKANHGNFKLKLKDIMANKVWAKSFKGRFFVRIEPFDKLPDLPMPLKVNQVKFACGLKNTGSFPVYSLRVVTASGKTYRGTPFLPEKYSQAKEVPFRIFSEMQNKPVIVKIPEKAIPDLKYDFNPKYGDMILAAGAPEWSGELGGGFLYGQPFNRGAGISKKVTDGAPDKVKTQEGWVLDFDGKGNYLTFPQETLPRRAFTIDFDIKPASDKDMVLLRCYFHRTMAFSLIIRKGKLFGAFLPKNSPAIYFETGLQVVPEKWSHIKVVNQLDKFIFSVNGKSESFPVTGRPEYYGSLGFGGPAARGAGVPPGTRLFKGLLKNLRIRHASLK